MICSAFQNMTISSRYQLEEEDNIWVHRLTSRGKRCYSCSRWWPRKRNLVLGGLPLLEDPELRLGQLILLILYNLAHLFDELVFIFNEAFEVINAAMLSFFKKRNLINLKMETQLFTDVFCCSPSLNTHHLFLLVPLVRMAQVPLLLQEVPLVLLLPPVLGDQVPHQLQGGLDHLYLLITTNRRKLLWMFFYIILYLVIFNSPFNPIGPCGPAGPGCPEFPEIINWDNGCWNSIFCNRRNTLEYLSLREINF